MRHRLSSACRDGYIERYAQLSRIILPSFDETRLSNRALSSRSNGQGVRSMSMDRDPNVYDRETRVYDQRHARLQHACLPDRRPCYCPRAAWPSCSMTAAAPGREHHGQHLDADGKPIGHVGSTGTSHARSGRADRRRLAATRLRRPPSDPGSGTRNKPASQAGARVELRHELRPRAVVEVDPASAVAAISLIFTRAARTRAARRRRRAAQSRAATARTG